MTMLGSNGKASHWVVRPASKETSRDERMAQLMYVSIAALYLIEPQIEAHGTA